MIPHTANYWRKLSETTKYERKMFKKQTSLSLTDELALMNKFERTVSAQGCLPIKHSKRLLKDNEGGSRNRDSNSEKGVQCVTHSYSFQYFYTFIGDLEVIF